MSKARFRFASEILRRLGEELNPSADQGIVELVKNAYDADARNCTVLLDGCDVAGGTLVVEDDGVGMTVQEIVDGWLVLGRSEKEPRSMTRLGRRPSGSKGLGRLAALRLGRTVSLESRPAEQPTRQYQLEIAWDAFDEAAVVEDVELAVRSVARSAKAPGTQITVAELRAPIRRQEVKRLARSLLLLADPFGDDPAGFTPVLKAPEFDDLERLVQERYFSEAEFHLSAHVDPAGFVTAKVSDFKGDTLWEATHEEVAGNERPYACPPATFELWAFLLSGDRFRLRPVGVDEVRGWLSAFGGVHLYVNGLRVGPYGEAGHDWLEMNLARVRSPEERPSTNNSIGRVVVDDPDGSLRQKTDRTGFIEDEHFGDLRRFAQDALEWMARCRLRSAESRRKRERKRTRTRAEVARDRLKEEIEKAPADTRKGIESALGTFDQAVARETSALRREVELYRTLSTAGITAATFAHESSGTPLKVIEQSIRAIQRRAKGVLGDEYQDVLGGPVDQISRALQSLGVLATATLRLLDHQKRRIGRVDVHEVVDGVLETFEPFLDTRGIKARTEFTSAKPAVQGTVASLESIVTNLITNSVNAFERRGSGTREIVIRTELDAETVRIRVLDTGPGIEDIALKDIWLPGQTTRDNGTGLGLTIVHDASEDLNGRVSAEAHGEFGGAEITVELPLLPK